MIRFNGMEIIVHRPRVVERTWKERWFSWPWQPLQRTKQVQDRAMLGLGERWLVGDGEIHCTEEGYQALMGRPAPPAARSTGYPFTSNGNGWAQRNGG